jgi:hypothetical protein
MSWHYVAVKVEEEFGDGGCPHCGNENLAEN